MLDWEHESAKLRDPIWGQQTDVAVVEQPDGGIELHIHHGNKAIRKQLREYQADPSYFLRWVGFGGTDPHAKYWLTKVVRDYHARFINGRMSFIFHG